MRCFIAVEINDSIRSTVLNLQRSFEPLLIAKMTEPKNMHFTLKFFGEISNDSVEGIKDTITGIASNFQPFEIELTGLDAFPSKNYIKILWIGAPGLFNLQKAVSDAFPEFEQDHPIIPHLTLARVSNVKNKSELAQLMKKHENQAFGRLTISNIKLKKSTLTEKGPVYEDLETFSFI